MNELSTPLPIRLNVGCGFDIRPGYLNVDFQDYHNPDLVADVTNLPMLPDSHFEEIIAQDVLEHFDRSKTVPALKEWARLLSPTGTLFIRVPSLLHLSDLLAEAEEKGAEAAHQIVHLYYGTQAYNGDYHLAGFTVSTLQQQLAEAGLTISEIRIRDTWLFEVFVGKNAKPFAGPWPLARMQQRQHNGRGHQPPRTGQQAPCQEEADLHQAMEDMQRSHAVLQADLQNLRHEVNALYHSKAWKVASLLRSVRRRFR